MQVLGIDLAAQPLRTGVVVLRSGSSAGAEWSAEVPNSPATDAALIAAGADADVVGVDAPLGWPTAFVAAVSEHHRSASWPGTDDRRPLTHRRTDDVVVELRWGRPMSASADKLGSVAMRCALLQREWALRWDAPAPRDGSGRLAEVYPAAALRVWDLPSTGYKASGRTGAAEAVAVREQIVELVATRCSSWLDVGPIADQCVSSDHVLDALLCAVVAVAVRSGDTLAPRDRDELRDARTEGWIHVPTVALDDLVPPEIPPPGS